MRCTERSLLSNLSRIVGPVQQRLALPATAIEIARLTVFFQLRDVAANGAPTPNLPQVILAAPPTIITAIPLEPAARIVGMNPTFASPLRVVARRSRQNNSAKRAPDQGKLGAREPTRRKLSSAIGHVFSAEHAERQHLVRRQLGRESGPELLADRFRAEIDVTLLHFVVHLYPYGFHLVVARHSSLSFGGHSTPASFGAIVSDSPDISSKDRSWISSLAEIPIPA